MQHPPHHSPARGAPVGAAPPSPRCRSALALCVSLLAATGFGGCSLSFPIASIKPNGEDVTGSIKPVPGKLVDEEDRRRAKAALSTAVDPQGDGQAVRWENPTSGAKGSFTPVGHAYPIDGRVCRAFIGMMRENGAEKTYQGTACAVTAGEWAVTERKPFKKS